MFYISDSDIERLVREDLQLLDITSMAIGIENAQGLVECYPKKACVLAGVEEAARIFEIAGADAEIILHSGSAAEAGQTCLRVSGTAGSIHAVYKQAQNVMEYSSGIATRTAEMLDNARSANPDIHVSVTRKHFPGGKALSIKAALAGGASLHRLGLSDSILVFDQHRVFVDDFLKLIPLMARKFPEKKIAAEANTPDEGMQYVRAGIDVVQCERFETVVLTDFVKQAREASPRVIIAEAGGVNASNAAEYAATGVDILVTSWPYFGKPQDIKMKITKA